MPHSRCSLGWFEVLDSSYLPKCRMGLRAPAAQQPTFLVLSLECPSPFWRGPEKEGRWLCGRGRGHCGAAVTLSSQHVRSGLASLQSFRGCMRGGRVGEPRRGQGLGCKVTPLGSVLRRDFVPRRLGLESSFRPSSGFLCQVQTLNGE